MDGMLSQDEINALLNGVDLSADDKGSAAATTATVDSSEEGLTDVEKDAIGEVANISMGTSATTLYSLVNRKVNITTPVVEMTTWEEVMTNYEKPCVFIQIKYTVGLNGTNILVLKEHDVKVITDLMMGGDGTNVDGEISELHLSAISEAMNQMMGSSATSLSSMLGKTIDISPPEASLVDLQTKEPAELSPFLEDKFVKISFKMQIEDLVDSTLMQLYPLDFAKSIYKTFIEQQMGGTVEETPTPPPSPQAAAPTPAPAPAACTTDADGYASGNANESDGWTDGDASYRNADEQWNAYEWWNASVWSTIWNAECKYSAGTIPELCSCQYRNGECRKHWIN